MKTGVASVSEFPILHGALSLVSPGAAQRMEVTIG